MSFRQIAISLFFTLCAILLGRWIGGGLDWAVFLITLGLTGFSLGVVYLVKGLKKPSKPEEAS